MAWGQQRVGCLKFLCYCIDIESLLEKTRYVQVGVGTPTSMNCTLSEIRWTLNGGTWRRRKNKINPLKRHRSRNPVFLLVLLRYETRSKNVRKRHCTSSCHTTHPYSDLTTKFPHTRLALQITVLSATPGSSPI